MVRQISSSRVPRVFQMRIRADRSIHLATTDRQIYIGAERSRRNSDPYSFLHDGSPSPHPLDRIDQGFSFHVPPLVAVRADHVPSRGPPKKNAGKSCSQHMISRHAAPARCGHRARSLSSDFRTIRPGSDRRGICRLPLVSPLSPRYFYKTTAIGEPGRTDVTFGRWLRP
jgi:hypothetical protein